MIHFQNITKKFRSNFWEKEFIAVDNVSFKISKGDLVGFLGANGAGKTTLIKILMDFSRPDDGEIKFDKNLGNGRSEIKSNIGYLPERAYLYPELTGREFLKYIIKINEIKSDNIKKLIENHTQMMSIDHALDKKISTYSKGMQQRLGFVSAIIHRPQFIVLDEPLSGLDPLGRRDFKKIMKDLNAEGTTIFFSSHVVSDVEEICNNVIFIEHGKLIYEGNIDSLMAKNTSNKFKIKYVLNNEFLSEEVCEEEKNKKIDMLLKSGAVLLGLEKDKMSLEEIIYKIKK